MHKNNKITLSSEHLIIITGAIGFIFYTVMLWARPMESWVDDAFYTDWALRISQGGFLTHIWENGKPGYCPLYSLLLAGWIKTFGFSYFSVHILGIIVGLVIYYLLLLRLPLISWMKNKWAVVCFSICYWLAPGILWIVNCGRQDILCILWSVLAIDAFVRTYENADRKQLVLFCLWAMLLMWTGLEGVIFIAIFVFVYSGLDFRKSLQKWSIYVGYGISTIIAFIAEFFYLLYHHCGKTFLGSIIGHSNTVTHILHFLETGDWKFVEEGAKIEVESMGLMNILNSGQYNGVLGNKEYLALLVAGIILLFILCFKKQKTQWTIMERALLWTSICVPIVFILIGRYAYYYTWAAYIPALIAFLRVIYDYQNKKMLYAISAVGMSMWLWLASPNLFFMRFDPERRIDKQHLEEIKMADILPNETVYIPYEWYYYLAKENKNLYAYWSCRYPVTMSKMIISNEHELAEWEQRLELEYVKSVGKYQIYKVLGDRDSGYLLPLSEFAE